MKAGSRASAVFMRTDAERNYAAELPASGARVERKASLLDYGMKLYIQKLFFLKNCIKPPESFGTFSGIAGVWNLCYTL